MTTDAVIALRKAEMLLADIAAILSAADQEELGNECSLLSRRCRLDASLLGE
jgi:hypothetical protein